ncbi:MAG: hypothetical protein JO089_08230, partial [Alphaproteobacteria bacterium]|nr:hypothetical protein [Alphaproteobacteria bacterium]
TGQTIVVHGEPRLALLPSPVLTVDDVEVSPPAGQPGAHLRIVSAQLGVPFSSLLSATPRLSRITLFQPVLEINRGAAWPWLSGIFSGLAHGPSSLSVAIDGGKIIYIGPEGDQLARFDAIGLHVTNQSNGEFGASGAFTWQGQAFMLRAAAPAHAANAPFPLTMALKADEKDGISFEGELQPADKRLKGALKLAWEKPSLFLPASAPADNAASSPPAPPPASAVPYPVRLEGQVEYDGKSLHFSETTLETPDSAGKADAALTLDGAAPQGTITLDFSRLKLNSAVLAPLLRMDTTTYLPAAQLNFAVTSETLFVDTAQFANLAVKGAVAQGQVQVENFSVVLPGNGTLMLAGNIQNTAKGPRFQGTAEAHGTSLRDLLISLDSAAAQLPEKSFGVFYLRSNIFISSEQLRISEADVKLSDLQLAGGLVTYFEAQPRVEAEIALKNTNLDYFRDVWREEQQASGTHSFIFHVNSSVDFNWLRQLSPVVNLHIALDGFRFLEKPGDRATFRIYARRGEFGLYDINFHYPGGTLKGQAKVSVAEEIPRMEVKLEMPELDTAYFSEDGASFGAPWVNPAGGANRWSQELFDFGWMIGLSGVFDVSIGNLVHHGTSYANFVLNSELKEEQLQFRKLSFERLGGRADATGTLTGGKVPGLSTSFTVYNVDMAALLNELMQTNSLSGRMSISGALRTYGINTLSWMRQADAKMVIAGRGVRAQHFNLQGVVDAVNAARSVADVVANVNRALPSATTDFSVDGNLNLSQGLLQTPGLALKSGRASANLTGQVDLMGWKMALNILFQLPMLQSDTVPVFAVVLEGAPDAFTQRIDTTGLEAYVAKRIVGQ